MSKIFFSSHFLWEGHWFSHICLLYIICVYHSFHVLNMNFNKNVDITCEIMDVVYRECALTGVREQLPVLEREIEVLF